MNGGDDRTTDADHQPHPLEKHQQRDVDVHGGDAVKMCIRDRGSTAPLRLQILSRQPRIRRDTLRHIVGLAERRGYPLDRLRLLRAPQ